MLTRAASLLVTVLVLGVGMLPTPAGSAPADDVVSHAEYRAIHHGMSRAQVVRATHGADFTTQRAGSCAVRFYDGWDRQHETVAVILNAHRRVQAKQTAGPHEVISVLCAAQA